MRIRLTSLLLCGILLLSVMAGNTAARTSAAPSTSPAAVVLSYFTIFSNIVRGASVSQLADVYAPNASFIVSTPTGQTTVFHKLPAIEGWYKAFAASHVGYQLKEVSQYSPVPGMVVHYETALNAANVVKGRCVHIFAVVNGMIVRDDFVVYAGS
ncbi:MAG TPA: hypothetical protein VHB98_02835 [Chloroflexota bacterium]|jgi:hypothetical protein|nr:hypothetical protein [Chloroflexota bacterium]